MLQDQTKQRQWRAYANSLGLEGIGLSSIVDAAWELVGPSCERLTVKPAGPHKMPDLRAQIGH